MVGVQILLLGGQLEILGQTLIQPKWNLANDAVKQGVRQLVPQILTNAVAPVGVDDQILARQTAGWAMKKRDVRVSPCA